MELTKPDFLPESSIPWMPPLRTEFLSPLPVQCPLHVFLCPSLVLSSVPRLCSVGQQVLQLPGCYTWAEGLWVPTPSWDGSEPEARLPCQVCLGLKLVFHKICKNFIVIPLSDLFKYVLWVKKSLGAAGCGEDRD